MRLTATWTGADYSVPDTQSPDCAATKAITVDVLPATPPGFFPPSGYGGELAWNRRHNHP